LSVRLLASRLVSIAGLALVLTGLAWLMFVVAGDRVGMRGPPDPDGTVEWRPDEARVLNIADILSSPASAWRTWDGRDYMRGGYGSAVWVRVTLRNPTTTPRNLVLADTGYFPDRVDAWVQISTEVGGPGERGWLTLQSGEGLRERDRPMWGRLASFPVHLPAESTRVVYLRGVDYFLPYLKIQWWPKAEDFFAMQLDAVLAESMCYGAMIALLIYNTVLWVRLRFADIGYYVLYAAAMGLFNFVSNGGLAMFGRGVGSPLKEMMLGSLLLVSGIFLVQFARAFLLTKERLPRVDRLLSWVRTMLTALTAGVVVVPMLTGLQWLNLVVAVLALTHALLLAIAVVAWRAGVRHARFFMASFGLLFAGVVPAVVTWWNGDILAGAARALIAGSTLEMIMLSFAVADRFAQAQRQLVEETDQRRMIQETYAEELETEVNERTRELQAANADKDRMLSIIGHDLRSPLTGLMRSADGATGELARETARTGRTLLLLIEDLVLWARLRAGGRVVGAHPARALIAPAVALHHTVAEHGEIDLTVEVPEDLRVVTDLVLAQTLVRNLLANALKFAHTRVFLRAEPIAGGVRFTVGNDGPALPPAVVARFEAGEDEPITATSGLGLRLCREICRALRMKLETRADLREGAEFSFTALEAPPLVSDKS
jgi:signal transduction histidine kinase